MNHVAVAGPLIQVINILGNKGHSAGKHLFKPRQGEMCRVGLGLLDFFSAHVVKFENQCRIPLKLYQTRHLFNPVPIP